MESTRTCLGFKEFLSLLAIVVSMNGAAPNLTLGDVAVRLEALCEPAPSEQMKWAIS